MFCKHEWRMLSEAVTKSKFEHTMECVRKETKKINIPQQMCCAERKHIQVYACSKCGKLKRYVEDI